MDGQGLWWGWWLWMGKSETINKLTVHGRERRGKKSGRILLIGKSHKKRNIGLRHANRFGCRHKIVKHTSPTTTPKCPHCSSVSQSLFISLYRRCEDWLASFLPCSVKDSDSWYQVVLRGMSFFVWFCNSYYFVIYYILDYFYLFIPPTPPTYTATTLCNHIDGQARNKYIPMPLLVDSFHKQSKMWQWKFKRNDTTVTRKGIYPNGIQ